MPVLLGITTAFALACAALCWTILNDSSNIMTKSDDIVLSDFSGMTQDEVNASEQVASGQVVVNWEEEYNNDYAAGYVYKPWMSRWPQAPSSAPTPPQAVRWPQAPRW